MWRQFLALGLVTPVLLWNAENHWASFAFQGVRAAPNGALAPHPVSDNVFLF